MSKRTSVNDNVPLSRFGVLVAQLESIGASAAQQPPDPLLCFDLLSDLISSMEDEPKESISLWQRKCEDALYSLLILGARRPVRHLASKAMAKIILKGDSISIFSRVSSLQGFLSDGKKSEPHKIAGAAQCLGELYRVFGRKITSGLLETANIATKLMKFNEEFVRQEALNMLKNALEGSGGTAATSAYNEAFRLITRVAAGDKSFVVRIVAARCLKAFADIGGPGLGVAELESSSSYCVKALEDPFPSVRDAYAEALGSLLALALNPEAQIQPRGKVPSTIGKKLEGALQRHLIFPFAKASGSRGKEVRIGLTLSWVFFLQAIRLKYMQPDSELENYTLQVLDMLRAEASVDAHVLACVLYVLRVGVIDQMSEPAQKNFLVFLGKQLKSPNGTSLMKVAALRTVSYTLKTLGEVPSEFKEVFDDTVVAALSHSSQLVRIEASLTLRTLAEVDPICVGGLISYGVTTLNALRENVAFEKGGRQKAELDSLHGQATVLAALASISPKLPLGYPARLPKTVLEVSKKLLTETSRNIVAAAVEKEAGWLLLASLLAAMPKEVLEDELFDILSLWADIFCGNPEVEVRKTAGLESKIRVWAAAVDALTVFIKNFVSLDTTRYGIMLQPVLVYLSCALSYASLLVSNEYVNLRSAVDIFVIRVLMAFQTLPDPMAYKSDHLQIIELCATPFRNASAYDESSCLRWLLDKRDAWLGPWIPGRDWFEDELRAFQGGNDGLMPCVWDNELPSFPLPETVKKTLVNQKLLFFGTIFASLDTGGMLSLLRTIEQCLKAGKKQPWRAASITNICVALLSGLKALLRLRPQPLGQEILSAVHAIFQTILAEGDICTSQRRASSEGLGLLVRLGSDMFTARLTRLLLNDLTMVTDTNYAGAIAFALGCIHRSAGGMALSSLVPATVSLVSSLAKSSNSSLQIWSLHGLLLTIEAAGLSYISHVQATLGLAMEILLSQETASIDVQQGLGRLINAIVAVLGPELSPGSILFSRCKSVVAEISSCQETATLLENARFTQQLVLFAPQAVSVHTHVQTLLPTLSSRQPTLRHLAVSTLRHLIEKDPMSIIEENIEENLFHMLDEETDSEIGNLVRSTILRLFYASCPSRPSHWIIICRNIVLATSSRKNTGNNLENDPLKGPDGETKPEFGEDDENMVSVTRNIPGNGYPQIRDTDKQLRYRTRIFAAECLSHLPKAVGKNPAHFDLSLARRQSNAGQSNEDWLVLHLQELISLAYQISTIQLENMQPVGVGLLSTILNKFEAVPDPELPGHLLLEQYQAQLVSAVRTALDSSSGPILLEAGLELATKIMTCGVISGDQAAVKRIFSLISRPLNEFKELYYPSFAEWVSSKIKVRLLAAHASLKCYVYSSLRRHEYGVPDEFLALLPLFSKNSHVLGKYWIQILKDYIYISLRLHMKKNWKPFLDGIQSPLVSLKLKPCLDEVWPVVLGAVALDSVPSTDDEKRHSKPSDDSAERKGLVSGFSMVELKSEEFHFIWSFSMLLLFQGQLTSAGQQIIPLGSAKSRYGVESTIEEKDPTVLKLYKILSPVFHSLSTERFYTEGFLTIDTCCDILQIFSYSTYVDNSWNSLAASVLSQIARSCPQNFLEAEKFVNLALELCLGCMLKLLQRSGANSNYCEDLINQFLCTSKTFMVHFEVMKRMKSVVLAFLLIGYKCMRQAPSDSSFSAVNEFLKSTALVLKDFLKDKSKLNDRDMCDIETILEACLNESTNLTRDCIESINLLDDKKTDVRKLLLLKLAFSLEQTVLVAKLAYEHALLGGERESDCKFLSVLTCCTNSIRSVFSDSNIQVQVVGLQVLKNLLPRGVDEEGPVTSIIVGELLSDLFTMIHKMLEKSLSKESVVVIGECLRILMLLQTISKELECQRGIMKLLLEAIVTVFIASEKGYSQEARDMRSTAIKVVSHIAQIPLSAVHFKEVLLSMPVTHRQKIQDIIRASVSQDQNVTVAKPAPPSLKLQIPVEVSKGPSFPSSLSVQSDKDSPIEEEDGEEDEDDWDTFQSFPASVQSEGTEKIEDSVDRLSQTEKSFVSEDECSMFQGNSASKPTDNSTVNQESRDSDKEQQDAGDVSILDKLGDSNQKEHLFDSQIDSSASLLYDTEEKKRAEEEVKPVEEDKEDLSSNQGTSTSDSSKDREEPTNLSFSENDEKIHDSIDGVTEATAVVSIATTEGQTETTPVTTSTTDGQTETTPVTTSNTDGQTEATPVTTSTTEGQAEATPDAISTTDSQTKATPVDVSSTDELGRKSDESTDIRQEKHVDDEKRNSSSEREIAECTDADGSMKGEHVED